MSIRGEQIVAADAPALSQMAAQWLIDRIATLPGDIRISLSGGSTPRALYQLLGASKRGAVPWQRIELFWGDERFVPYDSPDSNYRMTKETLLAASPIAAERVHPIPVEGTAQDCAARYEAELKRLYGAPYLDPNRPFFDIMLLGLGEDGHTCSLLPGQPVLEERVRWVAPVMAGRAEPRITLTYPAVNASRFIVFLVSGAGKAAAVSAARDGDTRLPAARIEPAGQVVWLLDRAAAGPETG